MIEDMSDAAYFFREKKITVMGLGLLGRGLGDCLYLAEAGAELIVTDRKSEIELEDSVRQIKHYPNVTLRLGEHHLEDFEGRDLVLVAAGVPQDSPYLEHARKHQVPLAMSATLLAQLSHLPVIGITGTRGKSTVTGMMHHALTLAGKRALLGGNVRGVSNLQLLHDVAAAEVLVLELDSWQLQGFGWAKLSPHIAVFTNFYEDHLNYYKDLETYFSDKANIYRYQKLGDVLIAGEQVAREWIVNEPPTYGLNVPPALPDDFALMIPGAHNRENAALAAAALRAFGLGEAGIKKGLETFGGVEGRLQFVRNINGVDIYNDNNATTPKATTAALKALGQKKNVVLICGGTDKGVSLTELVAEISGKTKHVVLYAGSGTEVLKQQLPSNVSFQEVGLLKEAVEAAMNVAEVGDIVLFSPGFSSFGHEYKNEYDRNDKFLKLVRAL